MLVKYIILPHGNPGNPEALKKCYAQTKAGGELTLRKLSREIVEKSPAVIGKFYAVIGKLPATVEKFPAIISMSPATVGKRPAIVENIPAAIEKLLAQ
ncbi:MAG: hypothetical protein LBK58_14050 [Prevotellaceae bacterium]|jgi:hypothetical protein|nr:hypothetical protein [Prevotellaceae bacterium]